MKWKLHIRDEPVRPPVEWLEQYDSKDTALERACELIRQQPHVKVLYIEGPNGEPIDAAGIEAWCKTRAVRH